MVLVHGSDTKLSFEKLLTVGKVEDRIEVISTFEHKQDGIKFNLIECNEVRDQFVLDLWNRFQGTAKWCNVPLRDVVLAYKHGV